MNKAFKKMVKKYFENDFGNLKNEEGEYECYNRDGGLEDVFTEEQYFNRVRNIESFEDLEDFWELIGGVNMFGVGALIDDMYKVAAEED